MPGGLEETKEIMTFLSKELSPDTYVNMMGQYRPAAKVQRTRYSELNRSVGGEEMREAYRLAEAAGLHRFDVR
jgi:putative pyruvate formate lyase activating enzyme